MSPLHAPCDCVCDERGGSGKVKHRGRGADSKVGREGGNRRWGHDRGRHRRWRRGPASVSTGREIVMREAMAHRRGGGPTGYGGQSVAGAGARRIAMRHVPAALRARIGERAGGVRFPCRCSSGLRSRRRAWPCARADCPRLGARREVGEGVRSGGSSAGMRGEWISRKRAASATEAALNCGITVLRLGQSSASLLAPNAPTTAVTGIPSLTAAVVASAVSAQNRPATPLGAAGSPFASMVGPKS